MRAFSAILLFCLLGTFLLGSSAIGIQTPSVPTLSASCGSISASWTDVLSRDAQQIFAPTLSKSAALGTSVAISDDKLTLVAGAPNEATNPSDVMTTFGAVYIFTRPSTNVNFTFAQRIQGQQSYTFFGKAVALGDNGKILAVTATGDLVGKTAYTAGAVYMYKYVETTKTVNVTVGNTTVPTNVTTGAYQQTHYVTANDAKLGAQLGVHVSLNTQGTLMTVAAAQWDQDSTNTKMGKVYVFSYSSSTNTWTQLAEILSPEPLKNGYFGDDLAASADLSVIAAASIYTNNGTVSQVGTVYLFVRSSPSSNTWTYVQKLSSSIQKQYQTFGMYLSLAADGSVLAVGGAGVVNVFTRVGPTNQWTFLQQPTTSSFSWNNNMGIVSVSASGQTLMTGAGSPGMVFIWQRQSDLSYLLTEQIGPSTNTIFAHAILSRDGSTLVSGAYGTVVDPYATVGAVWVLTPSTPSYQVTCTGTSTLVSPSLHSLSYAFTDVPAGWTGTCKVTVSSASDSVSSKTASITVPAASACVVSSSSSSSPAVSSSSSSLPPVAPSSTAPAVVSSSASPAVSSSSSSSSAASIKSSSSSSSAPAVVSSSASPAVSSSAPAQSSSASVVSSSAPAVVSSSTSPVASSTAQAVSSSPSPLASSSSAAAAVSGQTVYVVAFRFTVTLDSTQQSSFLSAVSRATGAPVQSLELRLSGTEAQLVFEGAYATLSVANTAVKELSTASSELRTSFSIDTSVKATSQMLQQCSDNSLAASCNTSAVSSSAHHSLNHAIFAGCALVTVFLKYSY